MIKEIIVWNTDTFMFSTAVIEKNFQETVMQKKKIEQSIAGKYNIYGPLRNQRLLFMPIHTLNERR